MSWCPKCGVQAAPDSLFCSACGTSLADAADLEPAQAYVGRKYPYYAERWARRGTSSWNWAAFFLGLVWMAHRKMYRFCWILLAVFALEFLAEEVLALSRGVTAAINFATAILIGLQGNHWYRLHVARRVGEISSQYPPALATSELRREGGVSWIAPFGFLLALFASAFVIAMLVGE